MTESAQLSVLVVLLLLFSSFASVFNVEDYGAEGNGITKDSAAIEKAIAACAAAGGGTVLFPSGGVYLTAPFNVTSNMVLYISTNATLLGSTDVSDWPVVPPLPSYCQGREMPGPRYTSLVHGEHVSNVEITGGGTIDGQGAGWWELRRNGSLLHTRGRLVELMYCQNFFIHDVLLTNSPFWTLHPYSCDNVTISDLQIVNPADSPNTDGIDPDSTTNVLIERVNITCGDDAIAIKSGIDYCGRMYNKSSENITIQDCSFGPNGHGISLGSESSGGIRNVLVRNTQVVGMAAGPKIKSARGRGGLIENITFANITLSDVDVGISVSLYYEQRLPTNKSATPVVRDVTYWNISGTAQQAGTFDCLPESHCTVFVADEVDIQAPKGYTCTDVDGKSVDSNPALCFSSS